MHKKSKIIAFLSLVLMSAAFARNPEQTTNNAGGKWAYKVSEDKLTGAQFGIFELTADEPMTEGIRSGFPLFTIMCGGGNSPKWVNSKLLSPVVLGRPDISSAFDVPQQIVRLRADNKIKVHAWNIAEDFRTLFVDKGATREFLNSKDARIQFRDVSEHVQVAIFSPGEINRDMVNKACGNAFK